MKRLIYLASLIILLYSCKRKHINSAPAGTLAEYPAHCYNNTLDSSEIGLDCGSNCKPCNIAVPTCTQMPNKLTLGAANYSLTTVNCGNLYNSNTYDLKGSFAGGTLTVRVSGTLPDITKSYPIDINSSPDPGKAFVIINTSAYGNMTSNSGNVFFNYNSGKYTATVCGSSVHSFVTSQSYSVVLNISCL